MTTINHNDNNNIDNKENGSARRENTAAMTTDNDLGPCDLRQWLPTENDADTNNGYDNNSTQPQQHWNDKGDDNISVKQKDQRQYRSDGDRQCQRTTMPTNDRDDAENTYDANSKSTTTTVVVKWQGQRQMAWT